MRRGTRRARQRRNLITGVAAAVVVLAAGSTLVYWNLPGTRVGRKLDQATELMHAMEYEEAETVYSEALSIDDTSVRAYRGLADDYLAQGRQAEAEEMLRKGYEATDSEVLLQNYAATVLNDIVAKINAGTAGLTETERCLDVLEENPQDADAQKILMTCAQKILKNGDASYVLLDGMDGSQQFSQYEQIMNRLFGLAEADAETFLPMVEAYAVVDASEVYFSLTHAQSYRSILEKAVSLGAAQAQELIDCLDQQAQVSAYFAPVFAEFEAENYKAAKELIVSEEYTSIRDAFIAGTTDHWYGSSYVPVTKEAIVFTKSENGWMFSFVENDTLAQPTGAIRVLGQTMRDLGVQRSSIEYVPAYTAGAYYPHTEYEIVYWNTMVSGIATDNTNVVSRMNYRFAEKIFTQEGMKANMIYDWGGPNEKRQQE